MIEQFGRALRHFLLVEKRACNIARSHTKDEKIREDYDFIIRAADMVEDEYRRALSAEIRRRGNNEAQL
jgi:hypothetical protein